MSDEVEYEITKGLVNELGFTIGLLEVLNLLVSHLFELPHRFYQEWVLISLSQAFFSLVEESLPHLDVLLLVSTR